MQSQLRRARPALPSLAQPWHLAENAPGLAIFLKSAGIDNRLISPHPSRMRRQLAYWVCLSAALIGLGCTAFLYRYARDVEEERIEAEAREFFQLLRPLG